MSSEVEKELEYLDGYKEIFTRTHSFPVREIVKPLSDDELSYQTIAGFQASLFTISALGSLIYAAFRTTMIFVGSEYKFLNSIFPNNNTVANGGSIISGIAILASIELFLFAFGYSRGKRSGKAEPSWWGFGIAISVSSIAGILSTSNLLESTNNPFFDLLEFLMVLLSGPGVAYLVMLGAENIGFLHNYWVLEVARLKKEHKAEQTLADELFQQRVDVWNESFQEDYRLKGRRLIFGEQTYTIKKSQQQVELDPDPVSTEPISDQVERWLAENNVSPHEVGERMAITPSDIVARLKLRKKDAGNVRVILTRLRDRNPLP